MNAPWFDAAGWLPLVCALLHTLWLGALCAGGLLLALRTIPARRARLRYGLCAAALLGVLLAGICAWVWLETPGSAAAIVRSLPLPVTALHDSGPSTGAAPAAVKADAAALDAYFRSEEPFPETRPWVRWAAACWLAGVAVSLWRAGRGLLGAEHLRRRCEAVTDPRLLAMLDRLREQLRLSRPVQLLVHVDIAMPVVVGIFSSAILLPASLVGNVPAGVLRAVLAHELAHIRRHDYLVNLGQMVIEALLFFNPFVWWISHRLRVEREACCDGLAAGQCVSRANYVDSLLRVVEHCRSLAADVPGPLLALDGPRADGGGREGGLLDRVRRVLKPGHAPALRIRWSSAAIFLTLALAALAVFWFGARGTLWALSPQVRVSRIAALSKALMSKDDIRNLWNLHAQDGTHLGVATRTVIFRLKPPRGGPPPTGSIWISYEPDESVRGGGGLGSTQGSLAFENGAASCEFAVPNTLHYSPATLNGYIFKSATAKVEKSDQPLTIDVPVEPAGAIYGEFRAEDPRLTLRRSRAEIFPVLREDDSLLGGEVEPVEQRPGGNVRRYVCNPLPLGKEYVAAAYDGISYAVSEPVRLSAASPIKRINLVIPRGTDVHGRIVNEAGAPFGKFGFTVSYHHPNYVTAHGVSYETDQDGCFTVPGINYDAPGEYVLYVSSKRHYRPAAWALKRDAGGAVYSLQEGKTLECIVLDQATGYPVQGLEFTAQYDDVQAVLNGPHPPGAEAMVFTPEDKSDAQGRFRFSNLPPEKVRVWTVYASLPGRWEDYIATPGQAEPLILHVKLPKVSEAHVVVPE